MRARTEIRLCSVPAPSPRETSTDLRLVRGVIRCGLALAGLWWICVASLLCGCNSMNGYVMNESGKSYYARGNYTAARHEFERASMDSPENANYAYNVAAAMQQQGDVMASERMYQHALTLDPSHAPSYEGLAHLLNTEGRTAESEQLLTAWASTQPYNAESNLSLARLQQNRGDLAGAEQSLQRSLAANPKHARSNTELAKLYQRSGRRREAAELYGRAMTTSPYDPDIQSEVATFYRQDGSTPALQLAGQMSEYDPMMQAGALPYGVPSGASGMGPYVGIPAAAPQAAPSIYPRMFGPAPNRNLSPNLAWGTPATVPLPAVPGMSEQQPLLPAAYQAAGQPMPIAGYGAPQGSATRGFFQAMPTANTSFGAAPAWGQQPTLAPPVAGSWPSAGVSARVVTPAAAPNFGQVPSPNPTHSAVSYQMNSPSVQPASGAGPLPTVPAF